MRAAPDYIQLYPTLRCDRSCEFCFNKAMPRVADMGLSDCLRMMDRLRDIGIRTIDIMGGEPTLFADLKAFIREAGQRRFRMNLSSNGSDPDLLAELSTMDHELTLGVSINDRETFEGLKAFILKHRPVVKSLCTPTLDQALIRDILALRPKKYYLLYRDAMDPGDLTDTIPFPQFLNLRRNNYPGERVNVVFCSGFLPDTGQYPELEGVRCPAGTTKLGIMSDGSVYPCNLFFGNEDFRLGNILSDPFHKIWHHPMLASFRTFSSNACTVTSCELHPSCHGGCPAHGLLHANDLSAPDPRCTRMS